MDELVSLVRIITLIITFGYATYLDIRTRIVPDIVWIPGIAIGICCLLYELITENSTVVVAEVAVSALLVFIFARLLYYFRIFYGADYKALVFISIVAPTTPIIMGIPLFTYDIGSVNPSLFSENLAMFLSELNEHIATNLFAFTVLANSTLFGVIFFVTTGVQNIRDGNFSVRRPLRSISAKKIPSSEVPERKVQVIETSEKSNPIIRGYKYIRNGINGISSSFYQDYLEWYHNQDFNSPSAGLDDIDEFDLESFSNDSDEWVIENFEEDKRKTEVVLRENNVWVTPSLPYILPLFLGLLSAVFIGNILYLLLGL